MGTVASDAGFNVYCLPPLKDRYIENHIYQEGGMLYVFLKDKSQSEDFYSFAGNLPYIEQILPSKEAAEVYHLPLEQIGDYVLLTGKDSAFGECEGNIIYTEESRTHGSLYEREVPLIAINPDRPAESYIYSKDISSYLFEN